MDENLILPDQALKTILENVKPTGVEVVDIFSGINRVTAEELFSKRDLPPRDNSAMDGFAVRSEDIEHLPTTLTIKGTIQAGDSVKGLSLNKGECYKIMTGAFLPDGADTVVEHELTKFDENSVTILEKRAKKANIRQKGEDIKIGDKIDVKGKVITPEIQSRLISAGITFLKVYMKPKVLVLSTGNEVTYPGDNAHIDKIIDANSFYISSLLRKNGAEVSYLGISKDDVLDFKEKLLNSSCYDFIVTSAGISEGDFDVVSNATKELNIDWLFRGVRQKPGKPFSFGKLNSKLIFALPGNPVSSAFCTCFYILPALKKMTGKKDFQNRFITAYTTDVIYKKNKRFHFNRGILKWDYENQQFKVSPYKTQDSHIISSIADCNCYMIIEGEITGSLPEGTAVKCFIYDKDSIF